MKIQAMMLAMLMLAGCGTVQTVAFSDKSSTDQLKTKNPTAALYRASTAA